MAKNKESPSSHHHAKPAYNTGIFTWFILYLLCLSSSFFMQHFGFLANLAKKTMANNKIKAQWGTQSVIIVPGILDSKWPVLHMKIVRILWNVWTLSVRVCGSPLNNIGFDKAFNNSMQFVMLLPSDNGIHAVIDCNCLSVMVWLWFSVNKFLVVQWLVFAVVLI